MAHRDQSLRYNSLVATGAQRTSGCAGAAKAQSRLSSRAEEFHLRALPEPCVNLSIHTAPDVRPLP